MERDVNFNVRVACACGIREAVIATLLWSLLNDPEEEIISRHGKDWVRITQRMITAQFPFMTIDMVQGSIQKLKRKGIISIGDFNEDRFNHTNWYAFSDYGYELMMS